MQCEICLRESLAGSRRCLLHPEEADGKDQRPKGYWYWVAFIVVVFFLSLCAGL